MCGVTLPPPENHFSPGRYLTAVLVTLVRPIHVCLPAELDSVILERVEAALRGDFLNERDAHPCADHVVRQRVLEILSVRQAVPLSVAAPEHVHVEGRV